MNEPISNKEVIDKLVDYFVKQNPKIVARLLANYMIDLNRVCNLNSLSDSENELLLDRLQTNCLSLQKFIEEGPKGDLTYGH